MHMPLSLSGEAFTSKEYQLPPATTSVSNSRPAINYELMTIIGAIFSFRKIKVDLSCACVNLSCTKKLVGINGNPFGSYPEESGSIPLGFTKTQE